MMNYKLFVVLCILLIAGCKNNAEIKDFTYRYSMESVGNFKVELQLNPDLTYTIIQNNYFFDRFESSSRPIEKKGVLSQQEFQKFSELVNESNINNMNDSYGFKGSEISDNSIIYIVELRQNDKSKFVTINANSRQNFPKAFTQLIEYTNDYINANLNQ